MESARTEQPRPPVYILFTPANVTPDVVTALINQVKNLTDEGVTSISLLLSSPGGSVYAGLLGYNFLKGCPAEVVTHNIGMCNSTTAVLYAAGDRRLSVPHGQFLMHGVSANFRANASLTETQLEERLAGLRTDTDNIAGVLAGATGKPETEIHEDMRRGLTLDPEQALDYGLVHDIREELYPAGARVIRVG